MELESAIEASDLSKTYPPGVQALDGVSLRVPAGTIFGLLGPNGAGKSTTVRVLTTLTRPDGGAARVAGVDVLADPSAVRRSIGVVGQKHGADTAATGRENLNLQAEFYGITGAQRRHRVADVLQRLRLTEVADRIVRTYSGGMRRRLDIAMGLLHRPAVLFLDEPTTGLDPEVRVELWREIERLAAQELMTILLTTHYMDEADKLAAQLAIIDRGRIVVEGTPDELKSQLRGDAIQIQLAEPAAAGSGGLLAGVPGVGEVELHGTDLRARAQDGSAAIPAVLGALEAQGVTVRTVTLARPSLDDVYLRHAGRTFTRADNDPMEVAA
ncbi:MAG TPA: ATP-binding cassette domain-containing protein [Solirubrobacteraceae bacterium]|jgi:ABC-2 type transport system ATP-binding protein|nr:ATP-binding cassette domain-containing protein [Solirubrobacteraceae bacterium]